MIATGDRHGARLHPETRPRGERHPNSSLTTACVQAIRALAADGTRHADIAERFDIADRHVRRIVGRRAWRHVQ